MMNKIIEEVSLYIKNLFKMQLSDSFLYHNLQHTIDVVNIVDEMADNTGLNNEEKELLSIAAWFHDSGYSRSIENHEEVSAEIAETYLKERNFPPARIDTIKRMILSTRIPQNPQNKPEEIMCDADLAYIGSEVLMEKIELLREEWKRTNNKSYTDYEWLKLSIDFIEANTFHTDYARKKFRETRKINLNKLKQRAAELKQS